MSDDSYDSDDSQRYTQKIRQTNMLITQLESKLNSFIRPNSSSLQQSINDNYSRVLFQQKPPPQFNFSIENTIDTNLLNNPRQYLQSKVSFNKQYEDLVNDFKQKSQNIQLSYSSSHSLQQKSGQKLAQHFPRQSEGESDQFIIHNTHQSSLQEQHKLQDEFLDKINNQLHMLQQKEDEKVKELERQVQHLEQQQHKLIDKRNHDLEEQHVLQKTLDDLTTLHQQFVTQRLAADAHAILEDQNDKLLQIKAQSDGLIKEEKLKKKKYGLDIKQLQIEVNKIKKELEDLNQQEEIMRTQKEDIAEHINHLLHFHNQFIQMDLKKSSFQQTPSRIVDNTTPKKDSRIIQRSPNVKENIQLEYIQFLNHQMKESLEQQLQQIREEIKDQKLINQELLELLKEKTLNPIQQQSDRKLRASEQKTITNENVENFQEKTEPSALQQPPPPQIQAVTQQPTSRPPIFQARQTQQQLQGDDIFENVLKDFKKKHKVDQRRTAGKKNYMKPLNREAQVNRQSPQDSLFRSSYDTQFQDRLLKLQEVVATNLNKIK